MPFDSKKQKNWYHATDQTYLDKEPKSSRKVKETDLTTPQGGNDEREATNLQSSQGEIAPLIGLATGSILKGAATGAAKGLSEDSEVIGGIAGTLANTTGFAGDKDVDETPGADDKMGDEALWEDEVPEKGGDLASNEDLSVAGPSADSFMRDDMNKLEQTESIIIKRNGKYIPVPVFTAREHDYPSEPCGLCGTAYNSHKGKDHKFVEPKEGKHNAKAGGDKKIERKWQYGYENAGNCEFCDGTGKVTVEHLGLKECPRCDGEGNMDGGDMMMGQDPNMMDPNMQQEPLKPRPLPYEKKPLSPSATDRKEEQPKEESKGENPFEKKSGGESFMRCPNVKAYERWVDKHIDTLKKFTTANETVGLMFSIPTKELIGENKKIKGVLAYAGASLNDRIYLPEELSKGHEQTLPLLINHSSTAGAEEELHRLSKEVVDVLERNGDYQVGEVTLTWHPDKLTLTYEGHIDDEFFAKEVDDMDMAVSLGIYYNSDSPKYCTTESYGKCYTMIEGAEFREVSLVYHPGFPIATIEAVESRIKTRAVEAQKVEKKKATEAIQKKKEDNLLIFEGHVYEKSQEKEIEFEGDTYSLLGKESDVFKGGGILPKVSVPKEAEKELSKETDTELIAPEETKIKDLERKK